MVRDADGQVGFTAAFSGILAGSNRHRYFVPPVYDLLRPDGFFRREEHEISLINRRIDELEASPDYADCRARVTAVRQQTEHTLAAARQHLKDEKQRREHLRQSRPLTDDEQQALVRESQFQKAEYKRTERRLKAEVEAQEAGLNDWEERIRQLKQERKSRSAALQERLFHQFCLLNARGESRDLMQLFTDMPTPVPPAGTGECALPKLLQHAYQHRLQPLAFGEFWWGASPKNEVRHHGHFYPSCQGKCAPILRHMLIGLEVEPNPLLSSLSGKETDGTTAVPLDIVYEDDWLVVVNKPCGLLSVPGKDTDDSVLTRLRHRYPSATGPLLVHRLDMDTSGLLVAAKSKEVHARLQHLFETRQVKKRYTALLDGPLETDEGEIALPLAPDWLDRPRQKVDYEHGKPALTRYKVRCRKDGRTWIDLYPQTGRTHQLRIHAAHIDGLNLPIVGDPLYGIKSIRLCLHAAELEFVHPVTHQPLRLCRETEFNE